METLTRGELAQRCAVNFETVRYYEQQGLIPKPSRSVSNYRLYDEDTVRRIRFIKRSQELGFTLHEIKELLSLRAEPRAGCADGVLPASSHESGRHGVYVRERECSRSENEPCAVDSKRT